MVAHNCHATRGHPEQNQDNLVETLVIHFFMCSFSYSFVRSYKILTFHSLCSCNPNTLFLYEQNSYLKKKLNK
jgi:hypothetical protein